MTAKQLQPQLAHQEAVYKTISRRKDESLKLATITQLAETQRTYHIQTKQSKECPNSMDVQHTHTYS